MGSQSDILDTLLPCYLHSPASRAVIVPRFAHRLNICKTWSIPPGSSPPIRSCSDDGDEEPLHDQAAEFDGAVFCHSLWYFPSFSAVGDLFAALADSHVSHIYTAEWSGRAACATQEPHALAAQAEMRLYALRPADYVPCLLEQNVRAAPMPDELLEVAGRAGWRVARRGTLPTPTAVKDGYWETQYLLSGRFNKDVEAMDLDEEVKRELLEYPEKVAAAVKAVEAGGRSIESMDVAWAVLERHSNLRENN